MQLNIAKALEINGWMSDLELEWLAKTARASPGIIIEFGSYLGRSTRAICDNTQALVFAVDPWNGEYYDTYGRPIGILKPNSYEQFRVNLSEYIKSGQLECFKIVSDNFPELGGQFADFVFIDGDHRYEQVVKDIALARRLVTKGGIIAGHDYGRNDWPGVKQAVDEIFPEAQKVDTIWFIRQK